MKTAVQFGAGNIGRGFIAQLFHESEYRVIFVDISPTVLDAINHLGNYNIRIVGEGAATIPIDNIQGMEAHDARGVAEAVANCSIASTAVGAGALKAIAPLIAEGLMKRMAITSDPLNILICENLHDASDYLRGMVRNHLPPDVQETIIARTGFVQAVVSRMAPLQFPSETDPFSLDIRVEAYKRLPVDFKCIVGVLPEIVGVIPVDNFQAQVERKLYTHNCAHATLGYLGYLEGIEFGYEALETPSVRKILDEVLEETSEALICKHGFDRKEHRGHVMDLLRRFANVELGDTCFRLARDPLRKLAPDDRLVGAARLCETHGVKTDALAKVIAAALHFDAPEDPSAMKLSQFIKQKGVEVIMRELCSIDSSEPLGEMILMEYHNLPSNDIILA